MGRGMTKAYYLLSIALVGVFSDCLASGPVVKNSAKRYFPYLMPGKSIKIIKTWDPEKKIAQVVSEDGITIQSAEELVRLEEAERNLFREK
jgi:hypothetical protein